MKKKNMIKLCKNISKIKSSMIDRYSIIDDEYILRELVENVTDVPAKDVDKMVETVLYLIDKSEHITDIVDNFGKEDGKLASYLVIPITSNLQKHLFIEFNINVKSLSVIKSIIEIKNIYID